MQNEFSVVTESQNENLASQSHYGEDMDSTYGRNLRMRAGGYRFQSEGLAKSDHESNSDGVGSQMHLESINEVMRSQNLGRMTSGAMLDDDYE